MHRMIDRRAGGAQDAPLAPGVYQATPHLLGEAAEVGMMRAGGGQEEVALGDQRRRQAHHLAVALEALGDILLRLHEGRRIDRSEEHTSELQSLMRIPYAVFC